MSIKEKLKHARDMLTSPKALALTAILTFSATHCSKSFAQDGTENPISKVLTNVKPTTQKSQNFFKTNTPIRQTSLISAFDDNGYNTIWGDDVMKVTKSHDDREIVAIFPVNDGNISFGFISDPSDKKMQGILAKNGFEASHKQNAFEDYAQTSYYINRESKKCNRYDLQNTSPEKLAEGLSKSGYAVFCNAQDSNLFNGWFFRLYDKSSAERVGTIRCIDGKAFAYDLNEKSDVESKLIALGFTRNNPYDNIKSALQKDQDADKTFYMNNLNNSQDK